MAIIIRLNPTQFFFSFAALMIILYMCSHISNRTSPKKRRMHILLKLMLLLIQLIQNGAFKDPAKHQESLYAVVQYLVDHAVVFQHIVYDLCGDGIDSR